MCFWSALESPPQKDRPGRGAPALQKRDLEHPRLGRRVAPQYDATQHPTVHRTLVFVGTIRSQPRRNDTIHARGNGHPIYVQQIVDEHMLNIYLRVPIFCTTTLKCEPLDARRRWAFRAATARATEEFRGFAPRWRFDDDPLFCGQFAPNVAPSKERSRAA